MIIIYKRFLTIFFFFFSILNFYGCDGGGSGDGTVTVYSTFNSGTLDATFSSDGIVVQDGAAGGDFTDIGSSIVLDSTGDIYVAGYSSNISGNDDMVIWKYNSNGSLDRTFDADGIVVYNSTADTNDKGKSIAIDSVGNIYVTGSSINVSGNEDMLIWKYKSNGTIDTSFGNNGVIVYNNADADDYANSIVLDTVGNIYITGSSDNDMAILKYDSNGMTDMTFGNNGVVIHDNAAGGNSIDIGKSITIDAAGNLYVTGSSINISGNDDMVIWKYKNNGTLDISFANNGIVVHDNAAGGSDIDQGNSITLDSSERIYVTGSSSNQAGNDSMMIWKYKSDGSLDTTFNGNGIVLQNYIGQAKGNSLSVNTAGDIYVTGSGRNVFGKNDMLIWKYKSGGYLDTTFSTDGIVVHSNAAGGYGDDIGNSIVWDNLGKIYIAGQSYNADTNDDMVIWKYR